MLGHSGRCSLTAEPISRLSLSILGFAQLCSWGSLYYSFPLIAAAIGKDLGWSKTQLYGPATAGLVLAALAAYPVGVAIDRGYGRQLMAGGSLVVALLLAAWSQVHTVVMFSVIVAALGALQAATLYEAIFAVVARNATTSNIRSSITTLTLWAGFASTLFLPLVQWLLHAVDWRQALLWLAFINVAVCAPSYYFAVQRGRPGQHEAARIGAAVAVKTAIKSAVFWWLATALTAYSVVFSAFTYHMYPMLLKQGLDAIDVVQAIAVIGPSQVAGRLLIGLFASRLPMRQIGVFTVAVFPIVFCLLANASTSWWLAAGLCAAYGAANGIFTIVRGLAVPEMMGGESYGSINGLLTAPATLARALAPAGAAWLWTHDSSYEPVYLAIAAFAAMLSLAFWLAAASHRISVKK